MPYTYKKEGDKYVVYKKDGGKKVGSTAGNKDALNKYLAALHMHENNKPKMKYIKTFEDFTSKEVSTDLNEAVINNKADSYLIKMGIPKEKLADFKEAAISFITDEIMDEPGGFAEDIFEFYSTTKLDVLGDYAEDYLENEDESKSEAGKELNERERLIYVGTYRAKNGKTYKKWKDDENYISIEVNGTYVTIEGDGEKKTDAEVMKEIEDALKESTVTEGKVNEAGPNDEGDAKVLSFMKRLAKDWDIPVARAADFIKTSIKRNGY